MGNDGAKGGCPESPGALGKGSSEARGGSDSPPTLWVFGILLPPGTDPGSPLILSLSKSRVWTGPFLKTLPAGDLDDTGVNLAKGAGCLDPLLQGSWHQGEGRKERRGEGCS